MYEEELIFGPFTFRQFTFMAVGAAVAALSFIYVETLYAAPIAVVAVGVGLKLAIDHAPTNITLEALPTFLNEKQRSLGDVAYKAWLQKMIAQQTVLKDVRLGRGEDVVELQAVIGLLKQEHQALVEETKGKV